VENAADNLIRGATSKTISEFTQASSLSNARTALNLLNRRLSFLNISDGIKMISISIMKKIMNFMMNLANLKNSNQLTYK
jgi:hypothetical protein